MRIFRWFLCILTSILLATTISAFSPTDIPELWAWGWAGTSGEYLTLNSEETRGPVVDSMVDLSGNNNHFMGGLSGQKKAGYSCAGATFTIPDGQGGTTEYITPYPLISVNSWPPCVTGYSSDQPAYGGVYEQLTGMNAQGEFFLFLAMLNTRGGGNRELWGTGLEDIARINQESGGVSLNIAGTWTSACDNVPQGLLVLTLSRDSQNNIKCRANGVDHTSGAPNLAGTFDVNGFGWDGGGSSQFDDYLLEIGYADGLPSQQQQTDLENYLLAKWQSGVACNEGETRVCGSNVGQCQQGTNTCLGGVWGGCAGEVPPGEEVCDSFDNDCDGEVDEGGVCVIEPVCGDSIVEPPEQCDDGNTVSGDGCSATCTIEGSCQSDANNDGVVNIFDLLVVASEFGLSGSNLQGDVNNDSIVNIFDFLAVASDFGRTCVVEEQPTLTITSPQQGATFSVDDITIQYQVANPGIVDHVHLQLDSDPEVRDLDFDGRYTFANIPDGSHTVRVYMADVNHNQIGEEKTVSFTVDTQPNPVNGLEIGITALHNFDENTVTQLDQSGNNNDGVVFGNPTWTNTDCHLGGCFEFSGALTDYITIDENALDGMQDYTVSVWVRSEDTSTRRAIFSAYETRDIIRMQASGGSFRMYTYGNYGSSYDLDIDQGQWHHIVYTREGSTGIVYQDGLEQESNSQSSGIIEVGPGGLIIGQSQGSLGGNFNSDISWIGAIDDFALWNRALSADEVDSLFTSGIDILCTPGETRSCYTGPKGTVDVGICLAGTQTCGANERWEPVCNGDILPNTETANALDDDCDALVDEGLCDTACEVGGVCTQNKCETLSHQVGSRTCYFDSDAVTCGVCENEVQECSDYPDASSCNEDACNRGCVYQGGSCIYNAPIPPVQDFEVKIQAYNVHASANAVNAPVYVRVPLPRGTPENLYKKGDETSFTLFDKNNNPLSSSIVAGRTEWGKQDLRDVEVNFLATIPPNSVEEFYLRESTQNNPEGKLSVVETTDTYTIENDQNYRIVFSKTDQKSTFKELYVYKDSQYQLLIDNADRTITDKYDIDWKDTSLSPLEQPKDFVVEHADSSYIKIIMSTAATVYVYDDPLHPYRGIYNQNHDQLIVVPGYRTVYELFSGDPAIRIKNIAKNNVVRGAYLDDSGNVREGFGKYALNYWYLGDKIEFEFVGQPSLLGQYHYDDTVLSLAGNNKVIQENLNTFNGQGISGSTCKSFGAFDATKQIGLSIVVPFCDTTQPKAGEIQASTLVYHVSPKVGDCPTCEGSETPGYYAINDMSGRFDDYTLVVHSFLPSEQEVKDRFLVEKNPLVGLVEPRIYKEFTSNTDMDGRVFTPQEYSATADTTFDFSNSVGQHQQNAYGYIHQSRCGKPKGGRTCTSGGEPGRLREPLAGREPNLNAPTVRAIGEDFSRTGALFPDYWAGSLNGKAIPYKNYAIGPGIEDLTPEESFLGPEFSDSSYCDNDPDRAFDGEDKWANTQTSFIITTDPEGDFCADRDFAHYWPYNVIDAAIYDNNDFARFFAENQAQGSLMSHAEARLADLQGNRIFQTTGDIYPAGATRAQAHVGNILAEAASLSPSDNYADYDRALNAMIDGIALNTGIIDGSQSFQTGFLLQFIVTVMNNAEKGSDLHKKAWELAIGDGLVGYVEGANNGMAQSLVSSRFGYYSPPNCESCGSSGTQLSSVDPLGALGFILWTEKNPNTGLYHRDLAYHIIFNGVLPYVREDFGKGPYGLGGLYTDSNSVTYRGDWQGSNFGYLKQFDEEGKIICEANIVCSSCTGGTRECVDSMRCGVVDKFVEAC